MSLPDQEAQIVPSPYKNMQHPPQFGSSKQEVVGSGRSQGRNNSHMGESKSSNSQIPSKMKKPKRQNQFKVNKMTHEEIISFLFDLSSASVGINRKMEPTDLDSTQGLDSFLAAIMLINE